ALPMIFGVRAARGSWVPSGRRVAEMRRGQPILIGLFLLAAWGCGIHAQKQHEQIALRQYLETQAARRGEQDPAGAARELEASLTVGSDAETLATLADLCFRAAHRTDHDDSRGWYRDAAVYA